MGTDGYHALNLGTYCLPRQLMRKDMKYQTYITWRGYDDHGMTSTGFIDIHGLF